MFDIIKKTEYWDALNNKQVFQKLDGFTIKALDGLKHIQDAWMLNQLNSTNNSKVLEIGGANSRVLPALQGNNEKWNLDEFKGAGNGPLEINNIDDVKLVRRNLGEFSVELPDNYFDLVFSISVIEHIPEKYQDSFWKDHARIMKPGAIGVHVIDLYLKDQANPDLDRKVELYKSLAAKHGLRLSKPSTIRYPVVFRCDMASNSDWGMWRWNIISPALLETRKISQSVSLAMTVIKE